MKIALVSPYDYAYPGGVTEHIGHLATEFLRAGHEVHIIAPMSGEPEDDSIPLHKLGRPVGLPANGSIARVAVGPRLSRDVRQMLASGAFDIVHLHEPLIPSLPRWVTSPGSRFSSISFASCTEKSPFRSLRGTSSQIIFRANTGSSRMASMSSISVVHTPPSPISRTGA